MLRRKAAALRIAWMLAFIPALAHAWGPAGHRIIAELADRQLTQTAHAEVRRLMAPTRDRSLADISTWADDLRDERDRHALWRATSKLHFVNFTSASCRYSAPLDCAGGHCVVSAIERYARVLGDRSRADAQRAEALRFVVHFVADVHQPLHAGYRPDKGGNRFQLQSEGRGTNLHAIWDSPVLASRRLGWRRYAAMLARSPLPQASGTPAQWAEESCRATRDAGIYPHGHAIDKDYFARMRPLAEQRVRAAASRLADLLNRELDPAAKSQR
jgi:hypothetical protein